MNGRICHRERPYPTEITGLRREVSEQTVSKTVSKPLPKTGRSQSEMTAPPLLLIPLTRGTRIKKQICGCTMPTCSSPPVLQHMRKVISSLAANSYPGYPFICRQGFSKGRAASACHLCHAVIWTLPRSTGRYYGLSPHRPTTGRHHS